MPAVIGHSDVHLDSTRSEAAQSSLAGMFAALWRSIGDLRRRSQSRQRLLSLDDRTLKDIGLHRTEISSVLHYGPQDSSRRPR